MIITRSLDLHMKAYAKRHMSLTTDSATFDTRAPKARASPIVAPPD